MYIFLKNEPDFQSRDTDSLILTSTGAGGLLLHAVSSMGKKQVGGLLKVRGTYPLTLGNV